jgi:hypothetical protein
MPTIELTAHPLDHEDTKGDGPPIVVLHRLPMTGSAMLTPIDDDGR